MRSRSWPPAPSSAPYQLAPCLCSPRRVCEKKEDFPVVCGVSAGGVHLHPDRRPRCHHQDGERDHGRLLPRDHCEWRGPWGLPVGGPGGGGDTDVRVLQTRSTPAPRGGGLGQLSCMLRWPRGAQGPERWGRGRRGVGGKRCDRPWPRVSPECPGRTSPVTPGLQPHETKLSKPPLGNWTQSFKRRHGTWIEGAFVGPHGISRKTS